MKRAGVFALLFVIILTQCISLPLALGESAQGEVQHLKHNEAMLWNGSIQNGSQEHISYKDALRYFPAIPLPEEYKGCPIEACIVRLSDEAFPRATPPGEVFTLPSKPQDIVSVTAWYSDGVTSYMLDFYTLYVNDGRSRQAVDDKGYLLMSPHDKEMIAGLFLRDGICSLSLTDGHALGLFEIAEGVHIHQSKMGSSQVTAENGPALLADSELTELFSALCNFVRL